MYANAEVGGSRKRALHSFLASLSAGEGGGGEEGTHTLTHVKEGGGGAPGAECMDSTRVVLVANVLFCTHL